MRILFLIFILFYFRGQANAQVIFGVNNYTQYHQGELPIIISVPHGGLVAPVNIPDRTCNNPTIVWDNNTIDLARIIDTALYNLTGCRPHLIICNLKRTKIDCNRNIADGACGNPEAETAWTEFSDFIDTAQKIALSHYFKKAFYIDLHAHGHTLPRLELGYGLSASMLISSDSMLNLPSSLLTSSINNLVSSNVNNYSHAQLIRGSNSLGTLLSNVGFASVPSQQIAHPDTFPYFNGGYNTFNHTCISKGNIVNGVQIETPSTVYNGYSNRKKFADSIAIVLVRYMSIHQNINFMDCKRRPPVLADISNQKTIVGSNYNLSIKPYVSKTNGDSILIYKLSGVLPVGLYFDSTIGLLSGTPISTGNYTLIVKCKDIDGFSNSDTFNIQIDPYMSSISSYLEDEVKIYPNPTEGYIIVENQTNQKDILCEIYDIKGNTVFKSKLQNIKSKLNIEIFPPGFYTIKLKSKDQLIKFQKIEKL